MQIVNAGIDYLRLTSRDQKETDELTAIWQSEIAYMESSYHIPSVWNFQGYSGLMCDRIGFGARDDGMIFEAQGCQAALMFERCKDVEFHSNTPRMDFAVDVQGGAENGDSFETIYERAAAANTDTKGNRQRNISFKRQRDKADTVYVGSRNSGAYLCIYDSRAKHSELFNASTRRYEVRYSNDFARQRFKQAKISGSIQAMATSLVVGHCMSVGVNRDWFFDIPPMETLHAYTPKDDDKSFSWIESHVAKTVRRLIERGYGPKLAALFGVEELIPVVKLPYKTVFKAARHSRAKKE